MAKMPILLPKIEEQRKIGGFFKEIDSLITLHQRRSI
jgi:type I restriction enzyme S subunit